MYTFENNELINSFGSRTRTCKRFGRRCNDIHHVISGLDILGVETQMAIASFEITDSRADMCIVQSVLVDGGRRLKSVKFVFG
jgi:hypothetical protein